MAKGYWAPTFRNVSEEARYLIHRPIPITTAHVHPPAPVRFTAAAQNPLYITNHSKPFDHISPFPSFIGVIVNRMFFKRTIK